MRVKALSSPSLFASIVETLPKTNRVVWATGFGRNALQASAKVYGSDDFGGKSSLPASILIITKMFVPVTWDVLTSSPPFPALAGAASVIVGDTLILLGGAFLNGSLSNRVYSTTDGGIVLSFLCLCSPAVVDSELGDGHCRSWIFSSTGALGS